MLQKLNSNQCPFCHTLFTKEYIGWMPGCDVCPIEIGLVKNPGNSGFPFYAIRSANKKYDIYYHMDRSALIAHRTGYWQTDRSIGLMNICPETLYNLILDTDKMNDFFEFKYNEQKRL